MAAQSGDAESLFAADPELIEVGIGEFVIAEAPKRLLTPALGSCVAVAIYDPLLLRGGLAHVMLPAPTGPIEESTRGRFASLAVPDVVDGLIAAGSLRRRLEAKIAGGAAMFRAEAGNAGIGGRNVAEVRRQLALMSVALVAEDTGEAYARTVELALETGEFAVRSYRYGVRHL